MTASRAQTILGPILNPRANGSVDFIRDGAIACDDDGIITFVGSAHDLRAGAESHSPPLASSRPPRRSHGLILPPFLDAHTHIPQHPIRGRFMESVPERPPEGRLLAGLNQNVFPEEAKCQIDSIARRRIENFAADTLAQGVVGGAAYMTVHHRATELALSQLHELWSVGLVLMEMNCPRYLRTVPEDAALHMNRLAQKFGSRFIVTDRFAVSVGSALRRIAAEIAQKHGLRAQTHLNEQLCEKDYVERKLYPGYASYTDVYARDRLLDCDAILAHCIHMTAAEWDLVVGTGSHVAHCPTSNTLLASGIMPLDEVVSRGIDYAICTDVGASPTTSLLAEMSQYVKLHVGRSARATPQEALFRATLAPTKMLRLADRLGSFDIGKPLSFIEVEPLGSFSSADDAILTGLLGMSEADLHDPDRRLALDALQEVKLDVGPLLDLLERDLRATAARLENRVISVTLDGWQVWRRQESSAV